MRITRDTIRDAAKGHEAATGRIPRDLSAAWAVLGAAGACAIGVAAGHDPLAVAFGVPALAGGTYLLGRRVLRDDARVASLTQQRDAARLEVIRLLAERSMGPAGGADRGDDGAAPLEPRRHAAPRGGGRPGAVAPLAGPSFDAPLDPADAGATGSIA